MQSLTQHLYMYVNFIIVLHVKLEAKCNYSH